MRPRYCGSIGAARHKTRERVVHVGNAALDRAVADVGGLPVPQIRVTGWVEHEQVGAQAKPCFALLPNTGDLAARISPGFKRKGSLSWPAGMAANQSAISCAPSVSFSNTGVLPLAQRCRAIRAPRQPYVVVGADDDRVCIV